MKKQEDRRTKGRREKEEGTRKGVEEGIRKEYEGRRKKEEVNILIEKIEEDDDVQNVFHNMN